MSNIHAASPAWSTGPTAAAAAEIVDRGFDWGSAAVGAGTGAAVTLLLVALVSVLRGRRAGPRSS